MASVRPSMGKRNREQAKRDKAKDKAQRQSERAQEKRTRPAGAVTDEDPDIAGIIPGPQPIPEDQEG
jgi:hypothetical protein